MEYGTGLIDDPPNYTGDGEVGVDRNLDGPESFFGLSTYQRRDLNQMGTNACVWFYLTQALWTLGNVLGIGKILMSPLAGYYATRKRMAGGGAIVDTGCNPMEASNVLAEMGWCPWDEWTFRPSRVDKEPPFQAFIEMTKRKWFFDRRVLQDGEARCRAIRWYGASYSPTGIGLTVDSSFPRWTPEKGPWKRTGIAAGRHMVTYHAHEPAGVWIMGSYGSDNAKNNTVLVSWDTIRSDETYPVMVPSIDTQLVTKMAMMAATRAMGLAR